MKKILTVAVLSVFVIAVLVTPLAISATSGTGNILYVDRFATGDGYYPSLAEALAAAEDNDTIQINGTCQIPADFTWPAGGRRITITGGKLDFTLWNNKHFFINDHVTFTNIKLTFATIDWNADGDDSITAKSDDSFARTYLYANGHDLTVAADVTFTNTYNTNVYLFGGGKDQTVEHTNLTVLSGTYTCIFGGGYGGTVNGDTYVTVGGTVNPTADVNNHNSNYSIYGGGWNDTVKGNTHLTVEDSARVIYAYGGSYGENSRILGYTHVLFSGGSLMNLNGGSQGADTSLGTRLTMTGGVVQQIFGANTGASFGSASAPVTVSIRVLGGEVTRRIYGGCYNDFIPGSMFDILSGNYGYWSNDGDKDKTNDTFYSVTGKISLTLGADADISYTFAEDTDTKAIYAGSLLSAYQDSGRSPNSEEDTTILFLGEVAYTNHQNKLGAKENMMKTVMEAETAADEIHTVTYTANGAVITENCSGSPCGAAHAATATLALDGSNTTFTGSAITPVKITYSDQWYGEPLILTYTDNIRVGTATATGTAMDGTTITLSFAITYATPAAPVLTAHPETVKGKADGTVDGLTTAMEWRKTGGEYTPVTNPNMTFAAGTYDIRYAEALNQNASPAATVTIGEGPQLTVIFKIDGAVVQTVYVDWNGSVTNIPEIPAKTGYTNTPPYWNVDGTRFIGIQQNMTVEAVYIKNQYTVTLPAVQTGYTLTTDSLTVEHGNTFTFRFALNSGYSQTPFFAVKADGVLLSPTAGVYRVENVTADLSITVEGVADTTAPSVTLQVGAHCFDTLQTQFNDLYYNSTATVTITAADAGSGVHQIEYLFSAVPIGLDDLDGMTWNVYNTHFSLNISVPAILLCAPLTQREMSPMSAPPD